MPQVGTVRTMTVLMLRRAVRRNTAGSSVCRLSTGKSGVTINDGIKIGIAPIQLPAAYQPITWSRDRIPRRILSASL
jgi:hypothetical protein